MDDDAAGATGRAMLRVALAVGAVALGVLAKAPPPVYRDVNPWRVLDPIDEVAAVLRGHRVAPRAHSVPP